jgi:transcriptional regulator with XRE-family HTH domain
MEAGAKTDARRGYSILINVGERIRRIQVEQNLTGAELARRLETTPQQVSRWRAQKDLKVGTLKKICKALEIELDDFLDEKSPA